METPLGLRLAGLLATSAAAIPLALHVAANGPSLRPVLALSAFVIFAVVFWLATARDESGRLFVGIQTALAIGSAYAVPSTTTLVLLVVVATQLPFVVSRLACWIWMGAQTLLMAGAYHRASFELLATLLAVYAGFQLFGFYTAQLVIRERRARTETDAANAQLLATRALLADRVRAAERDRIAGDLHDLLGHDLVALSVNLEAASRHEPAAAKEHLERAHGLVAAMLKDVRDLVRATRARRPADLRGALDKLAAGIPRPEVHLDVPDDLDVADARVAEVILRCVQEAVTNAIRHGDAAHVWIVLRGGKSMLTLEARDDGRGGNGSAPGSGLSGMRRRVEGLGGRFEAGRAKGGRGFVVTAEIPVGGARP